MSTGQISQTKSTDYDGTLELAARIGRRLRGGELITLSSDLGGGKTTFVRGLASGMGSKDHVHSPSFTLSNLYTSDRLHLHHFDFYRLQEAGIMRAQIAELFEDSNNVVAVEWGDIVDQTLPEERLAIELKVTGDNSRDIRLTCPPSLSYLINDYEGSK